MGTMRTRFSVWMRRVGLGSVLALAVVLSGTRHGALAAVTSWPMQSPALNAMRASVGEARTLAAVRGMTLTGTSNLLGPGGRLLSVDRLSIETTLPSKYIRTLVRSSPPTDESTGFDGDRLIQLARSRDSSMTAGFHEATGEQRVLRLQLKREEVTYLLVVSLLSDRTPIPVRYGPVSRVESPDGAALAVEVTGPGGLHATVFANPTTLRPFLMEYSCLTGRTSTTPPTAGSTTTFLRAACALQVDDYRKVNGVSIPHHWRFSNDDRPTEEWKLEKVRVVVAQEAAR